MRKLLALTALLLAAACSDNLSVNPNHIDLAVGQTATITATRIPSTYQGIPWPPNRIAFTGTGPIQVGGVMQPSDHEAVITVRALSPGSGAVITDYTDAHTPGPIHTVLATVDVSDCATPVTLTPAFTAVTGKIGEPFNLHVTPSFAGGHFQWYWGDRGDTRTPISFTDTPYFIDFTPHANGSYPIWVRYSTICGSADAAFVVNVGLAVRRRGAPH